MYEYYEGFFGHVYKLSEGIYMWEVGYAGGIRSLGFPPYKAGSTWTLLGAELRAMNAFKHLVHGR